MYTIVEYAPLPTFKNFMTEVAEVQLCGDHDPWYVLRAEMSKLRGNAGYGGLIMNQEKHHVIIYVNESQVGQEIMDNHLYDLTELPDGFYDMEKAKKSINLTLPIHLGVFILNYTKLKMLTFYFDFINKFLSRQDFEYCEMDTDSAYMAISGNISESLSKLDPREEFEKDKHIWFVTPRAPQGKRMPGLFKIEFQGDKIVSLCSKSYCIKKFAPPRNTFIKSLTNLQTYLKSTSFCNTSFEIGVHHFHNVF